MFNLQNYLYKKTQFNFGKGIVYLYYSNHTGVLRYINSNFTTTLVKSTVLKSRLNKIKLKKLKKFRFIFLRYRKWTNKFFKVHKIHLKRNSFLLGGLNSIFGFSTNIYRHWNIFFRKKRFKSLKFRMNYCKSNYIMRRHIKKNYKLGKLSGISSTYKFDYNYCATSNYIGMDYSIQMSNIWKFSKYMQVDNLFTFNVLYSIRFIRIFNDFIGLYFFFKKLYSFSRNNIFRTNKFSLVYGITNLVFFKTFFYLKLALIRFFANTHFKRHRLLLLILYKFLRVDFLDFYKSYGFYGCEIYFFGKLGGFGGSQKKRYTISIGSRSSMSVKFRVYQHLYEYSTPHGRIGSKCKVTILN